MREFLFHLVTQRRLGPSIHAVYVAALEFVYAVTLQRPSGSDLLDLDSARRVGDRPTMHSLEKRRRTRAVVRFVLATGMVTIGAAHFVKPADFARIVPAALPWPVGLVLISGAAEIAGGLGLLVPRLRRWAGWGLVALYVCVVPANVNMAVNHIQPEGVMIPGWALWARLPFQAALIVLALWVSRGDALGEREVS